MIHTKNNEFCIASELIGRVSIEVYTEVSSAVFQYDVPDLKIKLVLSLSLHKTVTGCAGTIYCPSLMILPSGLYVNSNQDIRLSGASVSVSQASSVI